MEHVQALVSSQSTQQEHKRAVEGVAEALESKTLTAASLVSALEAAAPTRSAALVAISDVTACLQGRGVSPAYDEWRAYCEPAIQALRQGDTSALASALHVLLPVAASPALSRSVLAPRSPSELAALQYDVLNTSLALGPSLRPLLWRTRQAHTTRQRWQRS